ncbi:MAG: hypothetical protein ACETVN_02420, partial [Asgard group archaeon]
LVIILFLYVFSYSHSFVNFDRRATLIALFEDERVDFLEPIEKYRRLTSEIGGTSEHYLPHLLKFDDGDFIYSS